MCLKKGRPAKYHTEEQRRAARSQWNCKYHSGRGRELRVLKRARVGEPDGMPWVPPAPPSSPLPPSSPPSSFFTNDSTTDAFLDISTPAGVRFRKRFRNAIRLNRQRKARRYGLLPSPAGSPTRLARAESEERASTVFDSQPTVVESSPTALPKRSRFVIVELDSEENSKDLSASGDARESTPENDCTLPIVSSPVYGPA
ncbi:hypothetical protein K435DRAFT_863722 [Dendrothele bispora CBS 962.96]|uniref:Uncharacterized protein n=1 Tax=Dendrothele bispora (strain CBS 962.96) TaxID=1314807 RepID=A0A4S8LQF8_DENBC|nr:hypothetical protein K435DRAFT_863722 [Dendrothele bispora CBS 962.96]